MTGILKKFKEKSIAEPLSPEEEEDGQLELRLLIEDSATFDLEESEYKALKKKLEKWAERVAGGVSDEYEDMLERFKAAKKFDPQARVNEAEAEASVSSGETLDGE